MQHSRRVSKLAVGIARHLRWEEADLRRLEVAALLHDIGKIGVPDNVLFKPGKLNHDESDLMALHHRVSVDVLQAARVDAEVVRIISQSRDFSCGAARGPASPRRPLTQVPRILSVADAYDSLRSDLAYHKAKSHDDTVKILQENTGTQFDGNIINALARWAGTCGLNKCRDYQAEHRPPETGPASVDPQEARDADVLARIFSHLYLLENLYDAFYLIDADLQFVVWNEGAQRLVGQPAERLIDRVWTSHTICYADEDGRELPEEELPLREALASGQPASRNVKILNAAGRWTDVELQSIPLIDEAGQLRGAAELLRDKSRHDLAPREYREKQRSAGRDPLTGVANRSELKSQMSQLLDTAVKEDWQYHFSVIFVEIDHFKQINDRFGHETGDQVLIETARLLQQETYSGEIVGRHDGGQFMVVCPATSGEQAAQRADRIHLALRNLHLDELEEWALTGSFGVTQATSGDTVDGLLNRARQGPVPGHTCRAKPMRLSLAQRTLRGVAARERSRNHSRSIRIRNAVSGLRGLGVDRVQARRLRERGECASPRSHSPTSAHAPRSQRPVARLGPQRRAQTGRRRVGFQLGSSDQGGQRPQSDVEPGAGQYQDRSGRAGQKPRSLSRARSAGSQRALELLHG